MKNKCSLLLRGGLLPIFTALYQVIFVFLVVLLVAGSALATAPTETVIYSFLGPPDGATLQGSLVADAAGNLYGTTVGGGVGISCCGIVFELSPPATVGGAWTETILYTFQESNDGRFPLSTLIFDKLGNLYGTTAEGGTGGFGTVFELSPPTTPGGAWTETILWGFASGSGGSAPSGKLVMDAKGNLYGTTAKGGPCGCGNVFELLPPKTSGEPWTQKVLYNFGAVAGDGVNVGPDLLLRDGILYGTTTANGGTVFQLVPKPGFWTETTLYSFNPGTAAADPNGGLIADSAGNLYGTTTGESVQCEEGCTGTIYELSPPTIAGDPWVETTLYTLVNPGDGKNPFGALLRDKLGNLYGTAYAGGKNDGTDGTVFMLKPPAVSGGDWTFTVLHYFRGVAVGDGAGPFGALIDVKGAFYGTTYSGGKKYTETRTGGTVFSVVP
jgi:uncharacterized repeat protein (TIGR03803 family)